MAGQEQPEGIQDNTQAHRVQHTYLLSPPLGGHDLKGCACLA